MEKNVGKLKESTDFTSKVIRRENSRKDGKVKCVITQKKRL